MNYKPYSMSKYLLALLFAAISLTAAAQPKKVEPKAMSWQDVSSWRYMPSNSVNMSADGKWIAYAMVSIEGDGEIILQNVSTDSVKKYAVGGNLNPSMQFSEDGKWFAFKEYPKYKESKAAAKNPGKQVFQTLHLIELSTLTKTDFDKAGAFDFNGKAETYLAVELVKENAPGAKAGEDGSAPP